MTGRTRTGTGWFPQAAIGAAFLVVGATLVPSQFRNDPVAAAQHLVLAGGYAVAAGISRRMPAVALAVAALVGLAQAVTGGAVQVVQLALLVVVYAGARWGSTMTTTVAALAVPVGALVGMIQLDQFHVADDAPAAGDLLTEMLLRRAIYWHADSLVLLGAALLACAWASGTAVRMRDRALGSEQESAAAREAAVAAQETARLGTAQAELARDVHDVVGHSLAVVLAQAEAARVVDDPAEVQKMLGHIVTTTRTSLRAVRAVLNGTVADTTGSLDDLVAGVAASRSVIRESSGDARPIPPELQVVAHRVFQEMLTNALRHGSRDTPIRIDTLWAADHLVLTVSNHASGLPSATGQGVPGMVRRLEAVGGTFDLTHDDHVVTARAAIPVRPVPLSVVQ